MLGVVVGIVLMVSAMVSALGTEGPRWTVKYPNGALADTTVWDRPVPGRRIERYTLIRVALDSVRVDTVHAF